MILAATTLHGRRRAPTPAGTIARVVALAILSALAIPGCDTSAPPAVADLRLAHASLEVALLPSVAVPFAEAKAHSEPRTVDLDEPRTVDLGKVAEGDELRHTFAIRNTTETSLKVVAIKRSCGCETTNVTEGTAVPPGGLLEVGYALSKYGVGPRNGQLVITTDAEDQSLRVIELSLRGEIQPKIWTTPSELNLAADDASTSEHLLRVESIVPGLLDTFQDATTNRGNVIVQLTEKSADALVFRVAIAPDAPLGTSYDLIYVAFHNREHPSLNVRVRASQGQPLVLLPTSLILPPFVGAEPQVRKIRIMSPAASAGTFRITKVESPPEIVVGEIPAESRHACDVKLTFTQPGPVGVEQKVVFHTDPPGFVTLGVRYRRQPVP